MELILGAVVSLVAQGSKGLIKGGEYKNLAIVLGLSLVAAWVYTLLSYSGYWDSVQEVLVSAGAFYTFILARFK